MQRGIFFSWHIETLEKVRAQALSPHSQQVLSLLQEDTLSPVCSVLPKQSSSCPLQSQALWSLMAHCKAFAQGVVCCDYPIQSIKKCQGLV